MMMTLFVGISLKTYFGYADTLAWVGEVTALVQARPRLVGLELFLLPTFPALPRVSEILTGSGIRLGAQDVAPGDAGDQTGEVTAAVLVELGCRYVEVGHAERRTRFGETEDLVAAKTATAMASGLTPVLCLGEADRVPVAAAVAECVQQLRSALAAKRVTGDLLIAYEPFWAIGAAEPASDQHIAGVINGLREAAAEQAVAAHVIYGGSAGPGLLTRLGTDVDGLFLGRFAHDPQAVAAVLDEAEPLARDLDRTGGG